MSETDQAFPPGHEAESDDTRAIIARLTSENNALHMQLISSADSQDQRALKASLVIRQSEQELQDLRFLNSQHRLAIQNVQERLEDERRRATDLFKKYQLLGAHKSSHTSDHSAAQRILLPHGPLDPVDSSSFPALTVPVPQPHTVDLIQLSEQTAQKHLARAENAECRVLELNGHIQELKSQLLTRETEIHRLSNLVESCPQPVRDLKCDHLESQVEFLQQNVKELKLKLDTTRVSAANDITNARSKNAQLSSNLEKIQAQLNSLRCACENCLTVTNENNDEVDALQKLLATAREEYSVLAMRFELQEKQLAKYRDCIPEHPDSKTKGVDAETQALDDFIVQAKSDPMTPTSTMIDNDGERELTNNPSLVNELRQLYDMALSLSKQVEQVLEERNNFESLYLQTSEKFMDRNSYDKVDYAAAICPKCVSLDASLQARAADLKQCRSDLANSASQIGILEQKLSRVSEDLRASNDLKHQYAGMQLTQIELTKTLGEQARVIHELNNEIAGARVEASDVHKANALKSELHQLEVELAACKASSIATKEALERREMEVTQSQRRIEALNAENKCLSSEVSNVASDLQSLFRENERLCQEVGQIQDARGRDTEAIKQLQQLLQTHKEALRQAKSEQKQLVLNYTRLVSQFDTRGNILSSLHVTLSQLRQEIRVKDARISNMNQTLKEDHNGNNPILGAPSVGPDGSLTREWDAVRQELADDPSIMRRKKALQAAGS